MLKQKSIEFICFFYLQMNHFLYSNPPPILKDKTDKVTISISKIMKMFLQNNMNQGHWSLLLDSPH